MFYMVLCPGAVLDGTWAQHRQSGAKAIEMERGSRTFISLADNQDSANKAHIVTNHTTFSGAYACAKGSFRPLEHRQPIPKPTETGTACGGLAEWDTTLTSFNHNISVCDIKSSATETTPFPALAFIMNVTATNQPVFPAMESFHRRNQCAHANRHGGNSFRLRSKPPEEQYI